MRRGSPVRHAPSPSVVGAAAERAASAGPAEQPLAGAVHEAQHAVLVDGEHGDVDLRHHALQQRDRLERAEPLRAQRLAQRVHLGEGEAERIVEVGAARADRVVALAQRGEQVGERLQRTHDARAHRERRGEPRADDDGADGPEHARLE